jgi:hypothetical protein
MPENRSPAVLLALVFAVLAAPSRAEFIGCEDEGGQVQASRTAASPMPYAYCGRYTHELTAQSVRRPQVTIHPRPRYPGANAKRPCRFWLAKEYRVSGTVIVPHKQCWWQ